MNTEIFIIVTSLFTGGAERQAIWLANTLSNTGYSVNLLILKKGDELTYLVDKKIKIYRFQIYSIERSKKSFKNLRFIRLAILSILKTRKALRNSKKDNKVVISLANIVFCRPKAKIIEIIPADHPNKKCERISKILNLKYYRIKTVPKNNDVNFPHKIILSKKNLKQIENIINL